jgi:hypothetical protein
MRLVALVFAPLALAACSTMNLPDAPKTIGQAAKPHYKIGAPYKIDGRWYAPKVDETYDEVGVASWYGDAFHRKLTANGEVFDKKRLSAAHKTLPLPTLVEVQNLENGRKIVVRVNDRGPFVDDRVIDLALSIPWPLKLRGREGKAVLRDAFHDCLPRSILDRPKQGFAVPIARWLREDLRPIAEEAFSAPTLSRAGVARPDLVRRLWHEHLTGRRNHARAMWALLVLQLWLERISRVRSDLTRAHLIDAPGARP